MTEIKPGTPLPWVVGDGEDIWDTREDGEPGIPLFRADAGAYRSWGRTITRSELLADARYIVTACNAYPSLLTGLREAREALSVLSALCEITTFSDQYPAECERAKAALAKLDTLLSQGTE